MKTELLFRAAGEAIDAHKAAAEAKASPAVSIVNRLQNELEDAKQREVALKEELKTLRANLLSVSQQTPTSRANEQKWYGNLEQD